MPDLADRLLEAVIVATLAAASIDVGIAFVWRALRESDPEGAHRD